jgi:hypothetical protein
VIDVVLFVPLVLVLPRLSMLLGPVLLELFHVLLELHLPSWLEVDFLGNFIRNVSDIQKNDDHVRLRPSLMLTSHSHSLSLFAINILLREAIFNKLFSFFNVCTKVIELRGVVRV